MKSRQGAGHYLLFETLFHQGHDLFVRHSFITLRILCAGRGGTKVNVILVSRRSGIILVVAISGYISNA